MGILGLAFGRLSTDQKERLSKACARQFASAAGASLTSVRDLELRTASVSLGGDQDTVVTFLFTIPVGSSVNALAALFSTDSFIGEVLATARDAVGSSDAIERTLAVKDLFIEPSAFAGVTTGTTTTTTVQTLQGSSTAAASPGEEAEGDSRPGGLGTEHWLALGWVALLILVVVAFMVWKMVRKARDCHCKCPSRCCRAQSDSESSSSSSSVAAM